MDDPAPPSSRPAAGCLPPTVRPVRHRFFVAAEILREERVRVDGPVAEQVRRVLRLRVGEEIGLFCGDGWEYRVTLVAVGERQLDGKVTERWQPETEPRAAVWLGVAVLKGEKLEWVIQKGTELGLAGILLLQTARTIVTAGAERWEGRRERYRRIAIEAAEQCGRARVPTVDGPVRFAEALARAATFDRALLTHEESPLPLARAWAGSGTGGPTLLFVGPEGGFTPEEVAAAEAAGIPAVSLGPRVLRAETAALATVTLALAMLAPGG
jgi:16S rRNA (uracil1498-N3)-methyltransferase